MCTYQGLVTSGNLNLKYFLPVAAEWAGIRESKFLPPMIKKGWRRYLTKNSCIVKAFYYPGTNSILSENI
jgi:hypothetical protein